jgi:hypothetical protein
MAIVARFPIIMGNMVNRKLSAGARILWIGCLLAVSACAYRGGIDNPIVRKTQWFSYLDGDDIRTYCVENAPDSYRLVYNARYNEQLRSYELTADGAGGANLTSRAMQKVGDLTKMSLDDVLAPWRWQKAEAGLKPADFQAFQKQLEANGFYAGAPKGLRLHSSEFYWIASGCRAGQFYFHAWLYPEPPAQKLTFPDFLYARDTTGIAVNPPRPVPPAEKYRNSGRNTDDGEASFWLQVGDNGLGGVPNL